MKQKKTHLRVNALHLALDLARAAPGRPMRPDELARDAKRLLKFMRKGK